ncbi:MULTISPECIES: hypothetical protein [unclassified Leeuwenhoekiella]|uniref:hypothetical protein n=1 Tax=unclassified Leeuwenhoekiella TaxID=2615029 RepID=UPI000C448198|nr:MULTISPECIES: hypothetical protein [unclassified Leeuwenhoekiella]MAW94622.1 hypothetical protein [Leeuwenhoekiella sp.]MBA82045.1 hypothetical protein [Leeuwenhoekiella sp.]|tara:strand:- start:7289 stop:7978 length:690 start_codon:yes stop_codon:yes gene_type:complete
MRGKLLLYIYLLLGLIEIVLVVNNSTSYFLLHPLGVLLIYWFYYVNVRSHNYYLVFYFACELLNEVFFLFDFQYYFELVLLCYTLATISMIYHLWPLFVKASLRLNFDIVIGPLLGILGMLVIFWELLLLVFEKIPNYTVFFVGLSALLSWVFFCTVLPLKNRHPQNSLLYLMGGLMAIMAPTMFIYTYLWDHNLILALCMMSMLTLKWVIATFLIRRDQILETCDDFI